MDPEHLARLEEEREFLLSSIRDLEREHAAGDVDDTDFRTVRDGYVARAAAVLREIEQGRAPVADAARRPWWRRLVVPVATLAVGVALGLLVSNFAGQRLPGQTVTGGMPLDEVATLLAQGRSLLNTDTAGALAVYQRVLEIEPDNAEARTYTGWLVVLNGRQANDDAQVRQGIELLNSAAGLDPLYADPHCLLAVANGRFLAEPDVEAARADGQKCLDANPPRDMVPMIQQLLDSLPA
jgi:hypothetical protein